MLFKNKQPGMVAHASNPSSCKTQTDKEFKVSLSYIESLGRTVSNNQINKQTKLTKFRHIMHDAGSHGKDKQCTRRLLESRGFPFFQRGTTSYPRTG